MKVGVYKYMSLVQDNMELRDIKKILKGMKKFFDYSPDIKQEYLDSGKLYLEYVDRDDENDDEQLYLDIENEFSRFIKRSRFKKSWDEVCRLDTVENMGLFYEFIIEECGLDPLLLENLSDDEFDSLEEFDTEVGKELSGKIRKLLDTNVFRVADISEELWLYRSKGGLFFTENQVPEEFKMDDSEYSFGGVDIEDCIEYLPDVACLFADYASSYDSHLSASTYYAIWRNGVTEDLKKVFKRCCPKHGQKYWNKGDLSEECKDSLDSFLAYKVHQISGYGVVRLYMKGDFLCASVNGREVDEGIAEEMARVLLKEFSFPMKEAYICYNDEVSDNVKGYFCKECPDGEYIVTIYC